MAAGVETVPVNWCRFFAGAEAAEWAAGDVGTSIGVGACTGRELGEGCGVRLGLGDGLPPGLCVGRVGDGVGLGVGDVGDGVGRGVGDGVGLGVGDVGDGVGVGVGDVGDGVGLGIDEGLADTAAKATGEDVTAPATRKPRMVTCCMRATRRWRLPRDLGCRLLDLEIMASKVTIALHPHLRTSRSGFKLIICRNRHTR